MQQRTPSGVVGFVKAAGMALLTPAVVALLAGCGLKGPLVPAKPAPAASGSASAASDAASR